MAEEKVVRVKSKKSSNPKTKKFVVSIISTLVLILLILFLMSGAVNQRKLITSIVNWFTRTSEINGNKLDEQINGNEAAIHNEEENQDSSGGFNIPIEINKDGIYIKGHAPKVDNSNDTSSDNLDNKELNNNENIKSQDK